MFARMLAVSGGLVALVMLVMIWSVGPSASATPTRPSRAAFDHALEPFDFSRDRADGGERFRTLEPGSSLPSGRDCAARVRRGGWEPRPENRTANVVPGSRVTRIDGASDPFNARYAWRIDGDFIGTTDEIIQWGACKWGFDEDLVRAVAVQESYWRQSTRGDHESGDFQSYGLLQIKRSVHRGTFPQSAQSTSFNVDYALAWRRACYEGDFTWLGQVESGGTYRAGDEWGCVGAWYSGRWLSPPSLGYIYQVRQHLARRTWQSPGF